MLLISLFLGQLVGKISLNISASQIFSEFFFFRWVIFGDFHWFDRIDKLRQTYLFFEDSLPFADDEFPNKFEMDKFWRFRKIK